MDKKTAVVIIRFRKDERYEPPPAPPVDKPEIPVNVPPELRPNFVPPPQSRHPSSPRKKLQFVGYQSQDITKDQVNTSLMI
jgi:hypothetical protein